MAEQKRTGTAHLIAPPFSRLRLVEFKRTKGLLVNPLKFLTEFRADTKSDMISSDTNGVKESLLADSGDTSEYTKREEKAKYDLIPELKALLPGSIAGGTPPMLGYQGKEHLAERLTNEEQRFLTKKTPDAQLASLDLKHDPAFVRVAVDKLGMKRDPLMRAVNVVRANYGRSGQFARKKSNVTVVALSKLLKIVADLRSGVTVTSEQQENAEKAAYRSLLFQGHSLMQYGDDLLEHIEKEANLPKFPPFREFLASPGTLNVAQEASIIKSMVNLGHAQKAVREATRNISSSRDFVKAVPAVEGTIARTIATGKEKAVPGKGKAATPPTTPTRTIAQPKAITATTAGTVGINKTPTPTITTPTRTNGPKFTLKVTREKGKATTIRMVPHMVEKVDTKVVAKVAESNRITLLPDASFTVFTADLPPGMSDDMRKPTPPNSYVIQQVYEDSRGCTRVVHRIVRGTRTGISKYSATASKKISKVCARRCDVPVSQTMDRYFTRNTGGEMAIARGNGLGCTPTPTTDTKSDTVSRDGGGRSGNLEQVQGAAVDTGSGNCGPNNGHTGVLERDKDSPIPFPDLSDPETTPTHQESHASGDEGEWSKCSAAVRCIQAGGSTRCEGDFEAGRLCNQARPRECILPNTGDSAATSPATHKSSEYGQQLAGNTAVPRREPRCETDTRKVYEAATRSATPVQAGGYPPGNQDRRLPDSGADNAAMFTPHVHRDSSNDAPRLCVEAGKMLLHANSPNRVSRRNVLLRGTDVLHAGGEMLPSSPAHGATDTGVPVAGYHYGLSPIPSESERHMDGDVRNGAGSTPTNDRASRSATSCNAYSHLQEERMGNTADAEHAGPDASAECINGIEAASTTKRKGPTCGNPSKQLRLEWKAVRSVESPSDTMDGRVRLPMGSSTYHQGGTGVGGCLPFQRRGSSELAHHEEGDSRPGERSRNCPAYVSRNQEWYDIMQNRRDDYQGLPEESRRSVNPPEPIDLDGDTEPDPEAGAAACGARGGSEKYQRRTIEASTRSRGVQSERSDLQQAGKNVGRTASGLVRSSMEPQVLGVRQQACMGPGSNTRGCNEPELGTAEGATLCSPASVQEIDPKNRTESPGRPSGKYVPGSTPMEAALASGGSPDDCDATDSVTMQQGAIITATSIQLSGGTTEPGLVNTGAVEMVCCFAYLRWALQSRGYTPELAAGFQSIYKQKADGKPGGDHHRAHWRRFWCYIRKAVGGGGWFVVNDVAICNCARQLELQTESHVSAFQSSIGIIMEVAWGSWTKEFYGRKIALSYARAFKAKGPKFTEAVDNAHMWKYIVKLCSKRKLTNMQTRDITMLLFKCATGCRSSDMFNFDARTFEYCLPMNAKGELVNTFGEAEQMLVRFRDPKDPLCVMKDHVRWSHAFVVQRIRYPLIINKNCEWLKDEASCQALDLFWHLQNYVDRFQRYLFHSDPLAKVKNNPVGCLVHGRFWMNVTSTSLSAALDSRPKEIMASTIGERTKKMYAAAGYKVGVLDDSTPSDTASRFTDAIAGHMTRGNFESLMYHCGGKDASFDKYDAVAMCRHSIATFFSSYYREVPLRPISVFNAHPNKKLLNTTEVSLQ